jgi:hypothetical protein
MTDAVDPPLSERLKNDLRIGMVSPPVMMTETRQLSPKIGVVVDLTVEHDRERARYVVHRLIGLGREIDNRQPSMCEADTATGSDIQAAGVWAPVRHGVTHRRQNGWVDGISRGDRAYDSDYAAHRIVPVRLMVNP